MIYEKGDSSLSKQVCSRESENISDSDIDTLSFHSIPKFGEVIGR